MDEAKDIRDKAVALAAYARQANDTSLERQVHEIRVRAERRTGELLRDMPKAKPRGSNQHKEASRDTTLPKPLSDYGITRDQSSEWQKLANVPEGEFEEGLANPVALPTAANIIAAHEAKTTPPAAPKPQVDERALWLWGRLMDFERQGLLSLDPNDLMATMLDHMKETTVTLAPQIAAWLGKIK